MKQSPKGNAIPFNRSSVVGNELEYMRDSIARGHISGDGYWTARCSSELQQMTDAGKALVTTSCTHALEMSALLCEAGDGDEVIMPAFTFVSTANAFVLRGARPVFIDIRPDTLNIDETKLEAAITEKTKAVVVVHYAGIACAMDAITSICRKHNLTLIEDNAHGLCGTYRGRPLGSFGRVATLSFHETKNFTSGEGGALLLNDTGDFERAEIIREKGTNRARFFRGQVDKYTWVDVGSSYLPSDMLAAFLFGQLERRDQIQARRRSIWEAYAQRLADWAAREEILLPHVPEDCTPAYHLFYLLLPSLDERQRFIAHMRERDILAVFHYLPLNRSDMGQRFGSGPCPVTEDISDRLVRLPLYFELQGDDLERVIDAVTSFKRVGAT